MTIKSVEGTEELVSSNSTKLNIPFLCIFIFQDLVKVRYMLSFQRTNHVTMSKGILKLLIITLINQF